LLLSVVALIVGASHLASLPATQQHTFGLKRTESLAALFSMLSLAFVSIGLAYEAVRRLLNPAEDIIDGPLMSGIATVGVIVNVILAFVLGEDHVHMPGAHAHSHDNGDHGAGGCSGHHDHKIEAPKQEPSHDHCHDHHHESHALISHDHSHSSHEKNLHSDEVEIPSSAPKRNINLHAAYLHVLGDLAQSAAILIAGLVIWVRPDWQIIDPICTLFFCTLVFLSTLNVVRSSIAVLLEETPPSVSWQKVYEAICNVKGVTDVHDLHIWCISHDEPALSVHCHSSNPLVLREVEKACSEFGIHHTTIQVQIEEGPCITCERSGCMATHEISDYERRSLTPEPRDVEQQEMPLIKSLQ
jgi:zinc transporter 2